MLRFVAIIAGVVAFTPVIAGESTLPAGALHRLGTSRFQMAGTVVSAGFTSDGKAALTATQNGVVVRTDTGDGTEKGRVEIVQFNGRLVLFSADGSMAAACGYDNFLRIVDTATGKEKCSPIRHPHGLTNLAWRKSGVELAAAGDGRITIWNVAGREVRTWEADVKPESAIACSPDGKLIAACGTDGKVRIWDAGTGQLQRSMAALDAPQSAIRFGNLEFSPDGTKLLQAVQWHESPVWEVATGKIVARLGSAQEPMYALAAAWRGDGKSILVAATNQKLHLMDPFTGERRRTFDGWDMTTALAISADGKLALTCGQGPALRLWDLETGRLKHQNVGHRGPVQHISYLDGGKKLATLGGDNVICYWDTTTGKEIDRYKLPANVQTFARTPDGKGVRFSDHAYSVSSRTPLGEPFVRKFDIPVGGSAARMSPDGRWLARVNSNNMHVFDLESGVVRAVDLAHGPLYFMSLGFSSDGRVLAAPGDKALQTWDVATGRPLSAIRLSEHQQRTTRAWAVSRDGRLAILADYSGQLSVIEALTGEPRVTLAKPSDVNVYTLALSADGRLAALAMGQGFYLFDLATGAMTGPFQAHASSIQCLAFSPDNSVLASGSSDTTTVLWNTARIRPTRPILGEPSTPAQVERLWASLAQGAESANVAVWALASEPKLALDIISRNMTEPAAPKLRAIMELIAELDHDKFTIRERATRDLKAWGELARDQLLRARAETQSAEKVRRIDLLLKTLGGDVPSFRKRSIRSLEVLERIGGPEAKRLVERMSKLSDAHITDEARRTLERLK